MKHVQQAIFTLLLFTLVSVLGFSSAEAAPQTSLSVQVTIDQPQDFWNCTFLPRDGDVAKPAAVRAEWSIGDVPRQAKSELVVPMGKDTGKVSIPTDKGAVVNLSITVVDAKDHKLGAFNVQIRNNGQTETIQIAPPETITPNFTWSNI